MTMAYSGTVHGKVIELDEPLPFEEGSRVEVIVTPEAVPRRGSPEAILKYVVGTLSEEEAETILKGAQECRRIDWEMWEDKP